MYILHLLWPVEYSQTAKELSPIDIGLSLLTFTEVTEEYSDIPVTLISYLPRSQPY
jgi:hypothetical protein